MVMVVVVAVVVAAAADVSVFAAAVAADVSATYRHTYTHTYIHTYIHTHFSVAIMGSRSAREAAGRSEWRKQANCERRCGMGPTWEGKALSGSSAA